MQVAHTRPIRAVGVACNVVTVGTSPPSKLHHETSSVDKPYKHSSFHPNPSPFIHWSLCFQFGSVVLPSLCLSALVLRQVHSLRGTNSARSAPIVISSRSAIPTHHLQSILQRLNLYTWPNPSLTVQLQLKTGSDSDTRA